MILVRKKYIVKNGSKTAWRAREETKRISTGFIPVFRLTT